VNLSQIKDRALRLLDDDTTNPVFYSDAELNRIILEALEVIAEEVAELRKEVYFPLRPGSHLYSIKSIADDIVSPYRLTNRENNQHIQYSSVREINSFRHRWVSTTLDQPIAWYMASWDTFGIYPAPTKGNAILRVNYIAKPVLPWKDGGEVNLTEDIHQAVYLYLCYDMLMKQWDVEQALDYFQEFVLLWRDKDARHTAHKWQADRRLGVQHDASGRN